MAEKKKENLFPDYSALEDAYNESLRKLGSIGRKKPEVQEEEDIHPIDAKDYKDPEKESPEVYDRMVRKVEENHKDQKERRSIWSDEPVIPVKKSIWLDNDEPAEEKKPSKANKETIEIKLSDTTREKLRAAQEQRARKEQFEQEKQLERERQRAEAAARAERARAEAAERARIEREQAEAAERARIEREQAEAAERARIEREQAEAAERARIEREKAEAAERARIEREQAEAAEKAKAEREKAEAEEAAAEKEEAAKPEPEPEVDPEEKARAAKAEVLAMSKAIDEEMAASNRESSRRRVRPEDKQAPRRRRPSAEVPGARTRMRPEAGLPGGARPRTAGAKTRSGKRRKKGPKIKEYETEFSFVNAIICMLIIFGTGIALLVMKRETGIIESEKRYYAEMPKFSLSSYFSGEYTDGIVTYYTDTIPNREKLKTFSSRLSKLYGLHLDDVQIVGDVKAVKQEELDEEKKATTTSVTLYTGEVTTAPVETEPGADPTDTTTKTTTTKKKNVVPDEGEWAGNVVIAGHGADVRAMPAFYGQFSMGEYYASVLNKYKEELGQTVNVFNMDIPLASAYYMPENMVDQFSDQHDCIENVGMNLKGVINVDIYDTLKDHIDEYIYSRTDHHWAPLGAYYAAQQFASTANVPFVDLSTYEKCTIEGFLGTMYTYSEYNQELADNPDTFYYYKPDNSYKVKYYDTAFSNGYEGDLFFDWVSGGACYSAFLGRDDIIAEVDTDVNNGRVLVIMKDSYGNALVPFLTHSFSKIYVLDFRYLNISAIEFMKNVGATDVLFSISISGAHTSSHIDSIDEDR